MILLDSVSIGFGGQQILKNLTLTINRNDAIGLVGPNGIGKTTILKLIAGLAEPDAGRVVRAKGVKTSYLSQLGSTEHLKKCFSALKDSYKGKEILFGLGFSNERLGNDPEHLSSGFRMRVFLADILLSEPQLILLDEPTNYMDIESMEWLEEWLKTYQGASIIVSHDQYLLSKTARTILELNQLGYFTYNMGYEAYLKDREKRNQSVQDTIKNIEKELEHKLKFVERFKAKATKARQAQSRAKQAKRLEKELSGLAAAPAPSRMKLTFPQPPSSNHKVAALEGVTKSFSGAMVLDKVSIDIHKGEKIAVVGPNGCGKTTLLKLLARQAAPDDGSVHIGSKVTCAYLSQSWSGALAQEDHTVLEEAERFCPDGFKNGIRTLLGAFLFSGDSVFKKLRVLSGGEKMRLEIMKLLLNPPNFLLLDEPTTHLDLGSKEVLEEALKEYQGTIVFTSHDRWFIDSIAQKTLEISNHSLVTYLGNYSYYAEKKHNAAKTTEDQAPPQRQVSSRRIERRERAAVVQERSKKTNVLMSGLKTTESEIMDLETEKKSLESSLADPSTYKDQTKAQDMGRRLAFINARLPELYKEWDDLTARLIEL